MSLASGAFIADRGRGSCAALSLTKVIKILSQVHTGKACSSSPPWACVGKIIPYRMGKNALKSGAQLSLVLTEL